jgi:hypothetical protein
MWADELISTVNIHMRMIELPKIETRADCSVLYSTHLYCYTITGPLVIVNSRNTNTTMYLMKSGA